MGTAQHLSSKNKPLRCSLAVPRAGLAGLPATASSLDRWGAVLQVTQDALAGSRIEQEDPLELDLVLPSNGSFDSRTMHCIGRAIQVSGSPRGHIWLLVRFHQVQFRPTVPPKAGVAVPEPIQALSTEGERGSGAAETETRVSSLEEPATTRINTIRGGSQ